MLIVSILLFITIGLLFYEAWNLKLSVRKLQLRIHVNGTRGKSSVTEYIAVGIGNAQTGVMAKITGVVPTVILNGVKKTIRRVGFARVQEQMNIICLAARERVSCLVLECMSISPELQILESRFFKPQIYVITNIKDDHREEMGITIDEQVLSICRAIPENCIVITHESDFLPRIKEYAAKKHSNVMFAMPLSDELSLSLPDGIFADNVSLALSVCEVAGISSELAGKGIINYVKNIKSQLVPLIFEGKEILFLNAFAVNDIESTTYFVNYWQKIIGKQRNITVLFNTRSDRPLRSDLFACWIAGLPFLDQVIITGDHANRAKHSLLKEGLGIEKIKIWNQKSLKNFKQNIFSAVAAESLIIGIGNIAGNGFFMSNELS